MRNAYPDPYAALERLGMVALAQALRRFTLTTVSRHGQTRRRRHQRQRWMRDRKPTMPALRHRPAPSPRPSATPQIVALLRQGNPRRGGWRCRNVGGRPVARPHRQAHRHRDEGRQAAERPWTLVTWRGERWKRRSTTSLKRGGQGECARWRAVHHRGRLRTAPERPQWADLCKPKRNFPPTKEFRP